VVVVAAAAASAHTAVIVATAAHAVAGALWTRLGVVFRHEHDSA